MPDEIRIRILLKNYWNASRQRINDEFLVATQNFEDKHVMGDSERQIFEEEQLAFHSVLSQVTVEVESAYIANNGTLRGAVGRAIVSLKDAMDEFKEAMDD